MHSLEVMYNIFNLYISKEWCQALDKSNTLGLQYSFFQYLFLFHTYDLFYDSQNMGLLLRNIVDDTEISHYTCLYNLHVNLEIGLDWKSFGKNWKNFWLGWTYVIWDKCHGLSIGFEQLHLLISERRGLRILSSYLTAWPNCISKAWI